MSARAGVGLPRLLWTHARIAAMSDIEYRGALVAQVVESLIGLGAALVALGVVFAHADALAGWRPTEMVALIGVYLAVGGAVRALVQPSMQRLIADIGDGGLDFLLLRPVDAQVLASVRQIEIWKLADVGLGVGLVAWAVANMGSAVGPARAASFALVMVSGGLTVYSFWLILATTAFWLVRVDNVLVIFVALYEAGRWPVAIYPPWLRHVLTFVVPVALATTVPAEALVGRLTPERLVEAVGVAIGLLVASRGLWRAGLRRYAGASA